MWVFHELRRYHTRPLRLNWGPENVHFGETHFRDPNISVKIFLKNYQAQLFFLHFSLEFHLALLDVLFSEVNGGNNHTGTAQDGTARHCTGRHRTGRDGTGRNELGILVQTSTYCIIFPVHIHTRLRLRSGYKSESKYKGSAHLCLLLVWEMGWKG